MPFLWRLMGGFTQVYPCLLFAYRFLVQSQVIEMLDFLQWKYLTLHKFTFSFFVV